MTAPVRSSTDEAVYATVSYADVFDMPIDLGRLHRNLIGESLTLLETSMAVDNLVGQKRLGRTGDAIYLHGREETLDISESRTSISSRLWADAEAWGRRIGRVPLVRMVAVIGRLAVDNATEDDTIDLFIVVRPRRLWLARRLIERTCHKAALSGVALRPQCIVSTRAMTLEERSVVLALELAQMAPIVGGDVCRSVRRSNAWMEELLPNLSDAGNTEHLSPQNPSRKQRWLEWFLLSPLFRLPENWERKRSITKLRSMAKRGGGAAPNAASFSTETYLGGLAGNLAVIEAAWRERIEG